VDVGKNTLDGTGERRLRWFVHVKRMLGNRVPRKDRRTETRRTTKEGKTESKKDGARRSMVNHGLTGEDTRDKGRWRNFDWGEKKPLSAVDKFLDEFTFYLFFYLFIYLRRN
jgi:hypothetical protein